MFALSAVPVALAAGAAVDYGRAAAVRLKLQAVTDSATLALCKAAATTSTADLQSAALKSIQGYFPGTPITVDPLVVTTDPRKITVISRASYKTMVAKIGRIDTVPVVASATCSAQETFFEIALALDNTGSMSASSGSQSKIAALRQAAADFVNYMFTTGAYPGHLKISLVPFSAAVAVDPVAFRNASWIDQEGRSSYHWQNITDASAAGFTSRFGVFAKLSALHASWAWAGCLESLPYPLNVQDGVPTSANPDSYYVPMLAPDEAGTGGSTSSPSGASSPNSYINDGLSTASGQPCTTSGLTDRGMMRQACKYTSPQGASTVNDRGDGSIGPNWMCRSQPLTRLTADKTTLLNKIAAMAASGNTDIHEGFVWGWRTVSPNSVFADGSSNPAQNTKKIVVLMTDGMNTWNAYSSNTANRSYYSAYGYFRNGDGSSPNGRLPAANANPGSNAQARAAMDQLTREACANARSAGILVYTIAFSVASDPIDAQGLQLLKDCAGSSDRAFVANDSNSLISTFSAIAQGIGELRLVK